MMLASAPPVGDARVQHAIIFIALVLPWGWLILFDRLLRRTR